MTIIIIIALLLLLRNYVKNIFVGQQNEGEDKYFHKISKGNSSGVVTQTIKPGGFGEIKFKGTIANDKYYAVLSHAGNN